MKYSLSATKELLRRLGASYHRTTPFLFKADPEKQKQLRRYRQQKPKDKSTRRYFLDGTHPGALSWCIAAGFCGASDFMSAWEAAASG